MVGFGGAARFGAISRGRPQAAGTFFICCTKTRLPGQPGRRV